MKNSFQRVLHENLWSGAYSADNAAGYQWPAFDNGPPSTMAGLRQWPAFDNGRPSTASRRGAQRWQQFGLGEFAGHVVGQTMNSLAAAV